MELVSPVRSQTELATAHEAGITEVLLGHQMLSTLGTLGTDELHSLANSALKLGLRPILLWDTLMRDAEFDRAVNCIKKIDLKLFSAVRVMDPGALEYILEETLLPVQLILRTGNHNIESILGWINYNKARTEKVILSSELPKKRIEEYVKVIPVKTEVLGLVPILLFYTPRYLLTYQSTSGDGERGEDSFNLLTAMASCEENTHKGFRVVETKHGTLVFHAKDYCLLEQINELKSMGVTSFQMDFRLEKSESFILEQIKKVAVLCKSFDPVFYQEWASSYPNKITRCFYQANATDVLFKKLKNTTTQRVDHSFVGEVIESVRDRHIIVHVTGNARELTKGNELKIITPMGKQVLFTVGSIRDLDGNQKEEIASGDFAVLPYIRSVTPTSVIYLQH